MLSVVGQIQNTYVVAEGPEGLYLLDQHAAHERIVFDRLIRKSGVGREAKPLLQPQDSGVDGVSGRDGALQPRTCWTRYGFIIEPFGDRSYLVRAVPEIAAGAPTRRKPWWKCWT